MDASNERFCYEHGKIRTCDPQNRNLMLYPLSYAPTLVCETLVIIALWGDFGALGQKRAGKQEKGRSAISCSADPGRSALMDQPLKAHTFSNRPHHQHRKMSARLQPAKAAQGIALFTSIY
jgi:hypothetical protein